MVCEDDRGVFSPGSWESDDCVDCEETRLQKVRRDESLRNKRQKTGFEEI